jgi:single-strand DNA-binding protein
MASFNRVILAGNLVRDPQLAYTPNNTAACEFSVAVNRRWRDRDGNNKEEVSYVDMTAYGRTGETINQYMGKGRPILVEGRLRQRRWTDKEGQNRSKLDVVVENFSFIDSGSGRGGGRSTADDPGPPPADDAPPSGDADVPF